MDFEKTASNFIDWLIDLGYVEPEDKELDWSDLVEDFKNAYELSPRLVNLFKTICDR